MAGKRPHTAADQEFHDRLRRGDERAIVDVELRYGLLVRQRLRSRFGARLNDEDLDDVLAAAQYRLWRYRSQYEPSRGPIGHWYYLIARSAAIDFIRRTPQSFLLSPEQWDRVTALSPGPTPSPSPGQAKVIGRVQAALLKLSDLDRRIVTAFAAAEGERAWSTRLTGELAIPPSTLRSRKRRAMLRLRQILSEPEATSGVTTMAIPFRSKALQEHTGDIESIVATLHKHFHVPDTSGLAYVATEWNRLLGQAADNDVAPQRELLKKDYLWYRTLDKYGDEYRQQIGDFLERVRKQHEGDFARTSFAERPGAAIAKLELALSEASGTLNLAMPEHVRRQGHGTVTLRWQGPDTEPDAEVRWEPSEPPIGLRRALYSGLRNSASLGHSDVTFFARRLIDEIRNVHELELPEFAYQSGLGRGQPPAELHWIKSTTSLADAKELPEWIQHETSAPAELQLEHAVSGKDPVLAELIDRVLCAAALEDYSQVEKHASEERVRAVEELVTVVARSVAVPREEVAALFAPIVVDHQPRARGSDECAANTHALQFLLGQLTEH